HPAAYTATKPAMTGLTKSTSLDGRAHDIACGQIDIGNAATELTAKMPLGVRQPNGRLMAEPTIDTAHVGRAVVYMAGLPLDANVQFMTLMATKMPWIGRGRHAGRNRPRPGAAAGGTRGGRSRTVPGGQHRG